jgi:glutamyl-tRNA(Gln) amidotransferase subunit E
MAAPDTDDLDDDLGLMAGLEIHQQLDTHTKLFCSCPTRIREPGDADGAFHRYLHPTRSELGEIDEAAEEESMVDRSFRYLRYDSTCLVEEDDEPPRPVDEEALGIALDAAAAMGMEPVDEAHVMRKIVIDGSNTTGFQRTALVATGGAIETSEGPVRVDAMSVEEESAQRVAEEDVPGPARGDAPDADVTFSLDRLGVPLVEIGTEPDIESPEQAQEAAERIGTILRSTGRVKRGLGTIRQDLNVSIADGARIEMKGVQSLDTIGELVRNEAARQVALVEIAEELEERAAVGAQRDVTEVFEGTESGVVGGAIESGGVVMAVLLEGFDGLVGQEIQPDRRLGTEMSDRAKKRGAGGIFHTDELPKFGITEDEVAALRDAMDAGEDDAVAIVADDADIAERAIEAVAERAEEALDGVPEETRRAHDDGTSSYLRPLPGAARMYPETDVYPVDLARFDPEPPEMLDERADRYADEHGLDAGLAEQVAFGAHMATYERAVDDGVDPTFAATLLESTLTELRRDDVPVDRLDDRDLLAALFLVRDDEIAKEAVDEVLRAAAEEGAAPDDVVDDLDVGAADRGAVEEAVDAVLDRKQDLVDEQGMEAFSALMGVAMEEMRGKADGELVSEVLRERLQERV